VSVGNTEVNTNSGVQEPEGIGERLKRLRLREAMSQAELARRTGITRQTLWHIERKGTEPHMSTRRMLSEALGVPADELTEGCSSPRATQKTLVRASRAPYYPEVGGWGGVRPVGCLGNGEPGLSTKRRPEPLEESLVTGGGLA
jgi:transcriptional regulator with XRE-family HTH domain